MTDAALADVPRPVSEVKTAGKFLYWAGIVLLCAWVLVPIEFVISVRK